MINIEARGAELHFWGRKPDRTLYKEIDKTFKPCFYVDDPNGKFVSVFGDRLRKVVCEQPSDVPKKRTAYPRHFEADIRYHIRYILDMLGELEKEPIRTCFFDIETESGDAAPQRHIDTKKPLNKVLCVGAYDSFDKEYRIFSLREGGEFEIEGCKIEYFDSEADVIKKFWSWVRKKDFDLFTGYNCTSFDMTYLLNRMKILRLDMAYPCRDSVQAYIDDHDQIKIWGRDLLDCYSALRKLKSGERQSWKLQDVAMDELGYGKEKYDGTLQELWEKNKKKFLEYNLQDVKLVVELDRKLGYIDYFDEMRRLAKTDWNWVLVQNKLNDCLMLKFCHDRYILPSIRKSEKEEFQGAYISVKETGVFKNVMCFDFSGLYPTIMMKCNISFETITEKTEDTISIGNGVCFRKDKLGIVPELLYYLKKNRDKYKLLMKNEQFGSEAYNTYDMKQRAMKIFSNSNYGNLSFTGSRVYNLKCAEAITFKARELVQKASVIAEQNGFRVLMNHTDSLYVVMTNFSGSIKDLEQIGKDLAYKIEVEVRMLMPKNPLLPDIELLLEFDEICQSAFFNRDVKGRNAKLISWKAGKWLDKPKLKVTGFPAVRSDTPKLVQQKLNEVFMSVLEDKGEEATISIINNFKTKFLSGNFVVEDIAISSTIKDSVPIEERLGMAYHVKAAMWANKLFDEGIAAGDKVRLCYVLPNGHGIDVIAFKDKFPVSKLLPDYRKMWNRYETAFTDICACMKWNIDGCSLSKSAGRKMQTMFVQESSPKSNFLSGFAMTKNNV